MAGRPDWIMDKLPVSCCHMDYGTLSPFTCDIGNAYVTGCASVLGEWLAYNAHVLGVVAIVATCVQVSYVSTCAVLRCVTYYDVKTRKNSLHCCR